MIDVRGFRAYRFDEQKVGSLDSVITTPFDVISPERRAQLAQSSPYNMAHLLLPKAEDGLDPYENAAGKLDAWIADGVLAQDDEESFYLLEQVFRGLDGNEHARRSFLARVKVPEPGEDLVLDHERTFATKVADRMRLTEETQANLGAVFVLYSDPDAQLAAFLGQMDGRDPDAVARTFDGVEQRLWRVPYDALVTQTLENQRLYIADGHHRFRTAREYRDRMRLQNTPDTLQPYDYALIGLVEMNDPGLHVWPTHRLLDPPEGFDLDAVLEKAAECFDVAEVHDGLAAHVATGSGCAIGLAVHGRGQYLLTLDESKRAAVMGDDRSPAWAALDVAVLHRVLIQGILGFAEDAELTYEPDPAITLDSVDTGAKGMAFLVKATTPGQIVACADAHDPMPEKATYFFPKLPSGAVIHKLV